MRGYRVEWNKIANQFANEKENQIAIEEENQIPTEPISLERKSSPLERESSFSTIHLSFTKIAIPKEEQRDTTRIVVKKKKGNSFSPNSNQSTDNKKKPNRLATFSFGLALIILAGIFVSVVFGWGLYVLFLLFSIPAFFCGLFGLKQIKRNPDLYDHEWYAWIGIGVGLLELLALLFMLGLFVSYFIF